MQVEEQRNMEGTESLRKGAAGLGFGKDFHGEATEKSALA